MSGDDDKRLWETLGGLEKGQGGLESGQGRIEGRLNGIDARLNGIDGRLDGIDGRLDGIDKRLACGGNQGGCHDSDEAPTTELDVSRTGIFAKGRDAILPLIIIALLALVGALVWMVVRSPAKSMSAHRPPVERAGGYSGPDHSAVPQ